MCTMLSALKLASLDSYVAQTLKSPNATDPMVKIVSFNRFQRHTQKVFALQIKEHQI